jgi:hypothetical protein
LHSIAMIAADLARITAELAAMLGNCEANWEITPAGGEVQPIRREPWKRSNAMPNVHVAGVGVSSLLEPVYLDDSFVPARGQLFFDVDTREMKIGDGVTAWSVLDPIGGGSDPGGSTSSGTAAPTTGTWARGDVFWNTEPSAGGNVGWVCVAAGSPGVWAAFGEISVWPVGAGTASGGGIPTGGKG